MIPSDWLDILHNNGAQVNPSSPSLRKSEWTFEENKQFENALVAFSHDSPDLFEKIGSRVKMKTSEEIKEHYQVLVKDIEMIESGYYDNTYSSPHTPTPMDQNTAIGKQVSRRKVTKWSHEEHRNFLIGLEKHGRGDWKRISRDCVRSRTPTQVASHAQKYFLKQHQQRSKRRSQNSNGISTSRDASLDTMVLPPSLSGPRVAYNAGQPLLAPHFC